MAALGDPGADLVVQLRRVRPGADPGRVGLHHADDLVDLERPDAAAGAGAARDRVRRGHERIGAVVEVEERALGALEQDVLAARERVLDQPGRVGEVRRAGARPRRPPARRASSTLEGVGAVMRREQEVLVGQDALEAFAQDERASRRSSIRSPTRHARSP